MKAAAAWVLSRLRPWWQLHRRPLPLVLALLHSGVLAGAVWLVVDQTDLRAVRVIAAVGLGVVALLAATSPGGGAGLVAMLGSGLGFLVVSAFEGAVTAGPAPPPLTSQVLLLTLCLYLAHALDALRGIVPPGATGEPEVLVRWVRRTLEALVPGLLIGAAVLGLARSDGGGGLWLLGGLGLLLAVGVPAFAIRPRPWQAEAEGTSSEAGNTVRP